VSTSALPSSLASRAFAAGGALVFALSFVAGGWRFVALGTPPAHGPLLPAALVNAALFGVFALHHSVLAREGVKAWVARTVSPALERPTYVWVASLLFIGMCAAWQPIAGVVYRVPSPWAWLAGVVQLTGGILTIDAARRIDIWVLSGLALPPDSSAPAPSVDDNQPLVAVGGYRLVRHPIYLGWVLLVWATSDMTVGRLVFAAVSTAYLVVAVPFEERSLRRRFGPSYDAYRGQVRWRILPGVY
jgi:protein-S-isoprenylcysteine O-methyltransferase Ste14